MNRVARTVPGRTDAARVAGRRGALLLEAVIAVAIFVAAGSAILAVVNDSAAAMARARDMIAAADLARSAMARLEAGIANVRELNGPVPLWRDDESAREGDAGSTPAGFADAPPEPSRWELRVTTDRSAFAGLTRVTVEAFKRSAPGSDRLEASYTLRQLVRLSPDAEDRAGEADELSRAAERGVERRRRFGSER